MDQGKKDSGDYSTERQFTVEQRREVNPKEGLVCSGGGKSGEHLRAMLGSQSPAEHR